MFLENFLGTLKEILLGRVSEDEVVAFLTELRERGETADEILGAAQILRELGVRVNVNQENLVDTCGTGGDGKGTFNISTAAALVVAGAGVRVAKHGNRSVSSQCGSADLLEAAGVRIDVEPVVARRCLQEAGIAFFFAPRYHPAMKNVAAARKRVGRSIFNLLGPLANPAQPLAQVVGIYDRDRLESYARVLQQLGVCRAWVVHGEDGLDEITLTGKTLVAEVNPDQKIPGTLWSLDPAEFGFAYCKPEDLQGRDASYNAQFLKGLLEGYVCPLRDAVVLNAAAALYVSGRAKDFEEGLVLANRSLDQGEALRCLKKLMEISNG